MPAPWTSDQDLQFCLRRDMVLNDSQRCSLLFTVFASSPFEKGGPGGIPRAEARELSRPVTLALTVDYGGGCKVIRCTVADSICASDHGAGRNRPSKKGRIWSS